jgi:hypothetical protein
MARVKSFYHDEICGREPVDEPEPEVCSNCGAYFDSRTPSKWQRCGPCRVGLDDHSEQVQA